MNGMLGTEGIIYWFIIFLFDKINFTIFDNKMYQRDNCIKSDIWSDVIFLVNITLFCDQGHKS